MKRFGLVLALLVVVVIAGPAFAQEQTEASSERSRPTAANRSRAFPSSSRDPAARSWPSRTRAASTAFPA